MFLDDAREHGLRIVEQLACRLALFRIIEDRRIAAAHFPGLEKRRPIDIRDEFADVIGTKHPCAGKQWARRRVVCPIGLERIGARLGQRQPLLVGLGAPVRLRHFDVFGPDRVDIGASRFGREERLDDTNRAARIGDIDGLALAIIWMDLNGRMNPARRRATNEKRQIETLTFHLGGDETHLVERGRDEARAGRWHRPFLPARSPKFWLPGP